MGGAHRMIRMAAACLLFATAGTHAVQAQFNLNFTRIVNNWPTIELYYKTSCDGQALYVLNKNNITIRENGSPVKDFTLWCPDPRQRCAV